MKKKINLACIQHEDCDEMKILSMTEQEKLAGGANCFCLGDLNLQLDAHIAIMKPDPDPSPYICEVIHW
jgi:hypothetical protein